MPLDTQLGKLGTLDVQEKNFNKTVVSSVVTFITQIK